MTPASFAQAGHSHTGGDIVDGSIAPVYLDRPYAAEAHSHTGGDIEDGTISAVDLGTALPKAKFISIDPFGAFLTTGAVFSNGFRPNGGIHLADGSNGSFYIGFTVPPDYATGGAMPALASVSR